MAFNTHPSHWLALVGQDMLAHPRALCTYTPPRHAAGAAAVQAALGTARGDVTRPWFQWI